jgi:hypothetical protein
MHAPLPTLPTRQCLASLARPPCPDRLPRRRRTTRWRRSCSGSTRAWASAARTPRRPRVPGRRRCTASPGLPGPASPGRHRHLNARRVVRGPGLGVGRVGGCLTQLPGERGHAVAASSATAPPACLLAWSAGAGVHAGPPAPTVQPARLLHHHSPLAPSLSALDTPSRCWPPPPPRPSAAGRPRASAQRFCGPRARGSGRPGGSAAHAARKSP